MYNQCNNAGNAAIDGNPAYYVNVIAPFATEPCHRFSGISRLLGHRPSPTRVSYKHGSNRLIPSPLLTHYFTLPHPTHNFINNMSGRGKGGKGLGKGGAKRHRKVLRDNIQ